MLEAQARPVLGLGTQGGLRLCLQKLTPVHINNHNLMCKVLDQGMLIKKVGRVHHCLVRVLANYSGKGLDRKDMRLLRHNYSTGLVVHKQPQTLCKPTGVLFSRRLLAAGGGPDWVFGRQHGLNSGSQLGGPSK